MSAKANSTTVPNVIAEFTLDHLDRLLKLRDEYVEKTAETTKAIAEIHAFLEANGIDYDKEVLE